MASAAICCSFVFGLQACSEIADSFALLAKAGLLLALDGSRAAVFCEADTSAIQAALAGSAI